PDLLQDLHSFPTRRSSDLTRDKVIRREFRINEGDAFNALMVKRSQDRIQSLGYFGDKFEIKQTEGSAPDRVILGANVEEKPTGQDRKSTRLNSSHDQISYA